MSPKEEIHSPDKRHSTVCVDAYPKVRSISAHRLKTGQLMDDIFVKIRFGIFNYFLILISGVILGAVLLETCAISFVIPVSHCDLNLKTSQKGILGACAFIGMICSSHLWGFLADTRGRRCVILPTLMITFALAVASSLTSNFYLFAILRFLNGFFISGSSATIYAYLGEFHNDAQRARAIMGSSVIYGVMCVVLPLMAWGVINQEWQYFIPILNVNYKPWRLFLVICSLPGFLASIALLFLPESPKFVLSQGDQKGAIKILEKINRWNNGRKSELGVFEIEEEEESIENRKRILATKKSSRFPLLSSVYNQTVPIFKSPYLRSTIIICILQFCVYGSANGFYMFFNDILNKFSIKMNQSPNGHIRMCDTIHTTHTNTSMLLNGIAQTECITKLEIATLKYDTILELIFIVGFIVIGLVINKIGKLPILMFLFGVSGAGGIICQMTDIPLLQIYSFMTLMCCGMAGNVISAITVETFPTSSRAMAICMALMFGRLGSVVGANIMAFLIHSYCETAFYLSGTSVLLCAVLSIFIPNIRQSKSKEEMPIDRRTSTLSIRV